MPRKQTKDAISNDEIIEAMVNLFDMILEHEAHKREVNLEALPMLAMNDKGGLLYRIINIRNHLVDRHNVIVEEAEGKPQGGKDA